MAAFQHILWGYELTYPDEWIHQTVHEAGLGDTELFLPDSAAFQSGYAGPRSGQIAVRAEWNPGLTPIEPLWTRQIGLTAGMMGAQKVGAAPWHLRDSAGLEAEIVLPKRENTRLWTGILARDFLLLHFMAIHPKEEQKWFDPYATRLISSLRYPPAMDGVLTTEEGLPLPPGYSPTDPLQVIPDITDPLNWHAYAGGSPIGALQAFYMREVPVLGWAINEYQPFPAGDGEANLGFARFQLRRDDYRVVLGLMPMGEMTVDAWSPASIVMRMAA